MRRFATASPSVLHLPVLRLPTVVFPGIPISIAIVEADAGAERPLRGVLTGAAADEISEQHGGQLALLGDGCHVGTIIDVLPSGPERGFWRHQRWGNSTTLVETTSYTSRKGMAVHAMCGDRVALLETAEKSACGVRMAKFGLLRDEEIAVDQQRLLEHEASEAHALLPILRQKYELQLCTLEEQAAMPCVELLRMHPFIGRSAKPPVDAASLSFWCAAWLPLPREARCHLLALQCPHKRMRDVVDAMRLLVASSHEEDA